MILLDTDVVTFAHHRHPNVLRRLTTMGGEKAGIAVVTRYEILRGRVENILKAADEGELEKAADRFRKSEEFLAEFSIIHFDAAAIAHFGQLRKLRNLRKIGRADLLIACIALAQGALLATRNVKDFKEVPGLRVENWVD